MTNPGGRKEGSGFSLLKIGKEKKAKNKDRKPSQPVVIKKTVYVWPLELIVLRDTGCMSLCFVCRSIGFSEWTAKTGFDMAGPDKVLSIMTHEGSEMKDKYVP